MPLLRVENLKVEYLIGKGWFRTPLKLTAVNNVSFHIEKAETLGLVGESGCGKSSLAKALVRLEKASSGKIYLNDLDILSLKGENLRKARSQFQMIFQDPYSSLNPRMKIGRALEEVLAIHSKLNKEKRKERVSELLELVGLPASTADRYPHQFSGGQKQRICIARALAVEPQFIVADEPVSALDVSVQAQIINLLQEIQEKTSISYLFIAHDLAVVEHISHRILVMYLGQIVESGNSKEIIENPAHPYTAALISAVPIPDPKLKRKRIILPGDVPSPLNPPTGCPFHPRCPYAIERCKVETPELKPIKDETSHLSACFLSKQLNLKPFTKII
ncbi:MAG TPA: dipeptide ABC transporter ATP-binding protein [Victivallales bacterium]|nr:dipeptide ABC transporter ATP-binding protein [Victivallales bacterium]HPO91466.1 dipeptide ABC transporter ATP-binding protein [Victivallales bacterium]HRR29048.1 dipeptide ABC transporter ATP-binding protein [Victivallales bacterium]